MQNEEVKDFGFPAELFILHFVSAFSLWLSLSQSVTA